MPRPRHAQTFTSGALAQVRELRERIENAKRELREKRAAAEEQIADIDQALAELGETPPANGTSPPPAKRARPEPKQVISHAEAATDRILDELKPLAPWLPGLRDNQRTILGMRMAGQTTSQIAAKLGKTVKDVSNAVFAGRARLRELKSRGAPAAKPTSDAEDEGEPAPAAQIEPQGTPVELAEIPELTAPPPRAAPGVPAHILAALDSDQWECFQAVELDGAHPDAHAWLTARSPQQVRGLARAAREKIDRLMAQEADGDPPSEQQLTPTKRPERDRLLDALGIPPPAPSARETLEARAANDVDPIVVGRPRGVRHCRRCGQPGHRIDGCTLDDSDLVAARLQDIAAACVRLGLSPAPPPPAPLPVLELSPAPALLPTWEREDLDGIAELVPEPATPEPAPPPPDPAPEPARIVHLQPDRIRSKTINVRRLTLAERAEGELLEIPDDVARPRTRGDCIDGPRPCPFVSCKHHLYLDVQRATGNIKLNFPGREVWELQETCSLDVADRGGITLEEVGALVNLTRERVRQVEVRGLDAARDLIPEEEMPDHRGSPLAEAISS